MNWVKFLGVLIDQELTWKNHINSVLKNIIKSAGLIAKLRHFTNKNTSKLIYYALVYPYLTYGNLVWGNTYPTRLQKLLNVQKKIVRLICFKSYMDHSEPIFLQFKILDSLSIKLMIIYMQLIHVSLQLTSKSVVKNSVLPTAAITLSTTEFSVISRS